MAGGDAVEASAGTPTPPYGFAAGEPALGGPAFGDPAFGDPAFGDPAFGEPDLDDPVLDAAVLDGDPAAGDPATVGRGVAGGRVATGAGGVGAGERSEAAAPLVLAEVPSRASGRHRTSALRRLVGVARVLTGGLMVLALVVVAAPLVLAARGPGVDVVLGHLAGAVVALAATGFAAWPRTWVPLALAAAIAVPVDVLVVLAAYWWA